MNLFDLIKFCLDNIGNFVLICLSIVGIYFGIKLFFYLRKKNRKNKEDKKCQ